jgi:hypothetical protein
MVTGLPPASGPEIGADAICSAGEVQSDAACGAPFNVAVNVPAVPVKTEAAVAPELAAVKVAFGAVATRGGLATVTVVVGIVKVIGCVAGVAPVAVMVEE